MLGRTEVAQLSVAQIKIWFGIDHSLSLKIVVCYKIFNFKIEEDKTLYLLGFSQYRGKSQSENYKAVTSVSKTLIGPRFYDGSDSTVVILLE